MKKTTVTYLIRAETSIFKKISIRLWYSDIFRLLMILGIGIVPVIMVEAFFLSLFNVNLNATMVVSTYLVVLFSLMIFNDYEELNRIGLTVNGKPLPFEMIDGEKFYRLPHGNNKNPRIEEWHSRKL